MESYWRAWLKILGIRNISRSLSYVHHQSIPESIGIPRKKIRLSDADRKLFNLRMIWEFAASEKK